MTHRFSRRGHGRRTNLFHQILVLAATRPVFTADYYAVDGVTGKVARFVDWNDATHLLAQSTVGKQVALPAAHADFGGKLCTTFTGVEYYDSNRIPHSWVWGSNGTGFDVYFAITNTRGTTTPQAFLCTGNVNTAAVVGMNIQIDNSTGNFGFYVTNGTAYAVNRNDTNQFAQNVPGWACASYLEGTTPEVIKRKGGTLLVGADIGNNPSASDPLAPLRLGGSAAGTLYGTQMRWRSTSFFPRLTSSQRSGTVDVWMTQDTGIAP